MSADQMLTTNIVSGALIKSFAALEIQAKSLGPTIGQAGIIISNNLVSLVGEFDQTTGASKALAKGVIELATKMLDLGRSFNDFYKANKDTFATVFTVIGEAVKILVLYKGAILAVTAATKAYAALAGLIGAINFLWNIAKLNALAYAGAINATTLAVGIYRAAMELVGKTVEKVDKLTAKSFIGLVGKAVVATAAVWGLSEAMDAALAPRDTKNAFKDIEEETKRLKAKIAGFEGGDPNADKKANRIDVIAQYQKEYKEAAILAGQNKVLLQQAKDSYSAKVKLYDLQQKEGQRLIDMGSTGGKDDKATKELEDKRKQMREFSAQYALQIADQQRINALVAEGKSIEDARYKVELDRQLIDSQKSGATAAQTAEMRIALGVAKEQLAVAEAYKKQLDFNKKAEEDFAKKEADFLKPEKFKVGDLFGDASKGAGALINAFQDINKQQEEYNELLADAVVYNKDVSKIEAQRSKNEIRNIGNILGATKGFFKEKSAGYKVISAAEKAFRAFELVSELKANSTKLAGYATEVTAFLAMIGAKILGVEVATAATVAAVPVAVAANTAIAASAAPAAVTMAAIQPGPLAFVGAAAMIALLASIGVAIGGGGSGATKVNFGANTAAGTGTVLGDRNAKSETLTKSIDRLSDIATVDLSFTSQSLNVLKQIAANTGSFNTSLANLNVKIGAEIRNISLPGNFTAAQVKANPEAFANQFFAALVGETKTFPNTQGKAVGNIFTQQVILPVLKGFEEVALLAGATTSEINKSLSTTVLTGGRFGGEDGGRNLNALSAEDRTALVNATASTLLDQLTTELLKASPSLAYLRQFQLAGEGLGETIIRVKSDIEVANKALFRLGYGAISLQAIVNKQGDIAVEAIKQVTSRAFGQRGLTGIADIISKSFIETGDDAEQLVADLTEMSNVMRGLGRTSVDITSNTLGGAGSFERLQEGFSAIFDDLLSPTEKASELTKQVTEKFTKLGLALPTSKDALKALITGLNTTTVAGQTLFGSVVALVPEFLTLQSAIEDIGDTASEVGQSLNDVAKNLYQTISDARSKSLSPTQSIDFLLGQFRDAKALALTQNGQNLATTAGDINSQINPLLDAIKNVYASGTAAQTLIDEVLLGAKAVADRAATEAFTYQDESLRLLQVQVNELEAIRVAIQGGTYSPQNIVASAMGNVFSSGNVVPFAKGGMFTNSIATGPTMAPMALFGESGPEAVLPLSRGSDGSLGVRIVGGGNSSAGVESKLDESNRQSAALVRLQQAANEKIIQKLSAMDERLAGLESAARLEAAS